MGNADAVAELPAHSEFEGILAIEQAVLDAIPAAVYVCSADGAIVRFNRRATELWGRVPRPGDAYERYCDAFRLYRLDGTPLPHASTPMETALRTGEAQSDKEVVIERPDGSRRIALVNIEPLKTPEGRVQGAINCFQDITERKRGEDQLRESEHRFREVLDALPAAIYATDTEGRITFFNQAAVDLAGRRPELGQDKWCVTWRLYNSDGTELPREAGPMAIALTERRTIRGVEAIAERPDGTRVPLMPFPTPLYDSSGAFSGAVNMLVDISDRKRVEGSLAKRVSELGALYRFTDALHRTQSLPEVYDAALDAIVRALNCNRASILFRDDAGVMRFVAWRGLSDTYRNAVEGNSPWQGDEADPKPICVEDIDTSDLSPSIKPLVKAEGIRAVAFIPLMTNGKLVGKFMAYYDAPHVFTGEEVDLALTAARQLAFGIERKRAEVELRQNEERLRLATQTGKIGLWDWDISSNRISWTDSLYGLHGVTKEDFSATVEGFVALVHPDDRDYVTKALGRTLKENAPYEIEFRALKPDGQIAWIFTNSIVLREGGKPVRMLGATFDMTERKRSEAQLDLLVAELSHRVKNTLATVIAIAKQSFANVPSVDEARRCFDARIRALAQTHSRLAEANWLGVSLERMVLDETAPYRREDGGNIRISGPAINLSPKCAVTLGLAIHELTTNAAKYGALSAKNGLVEIGWQLTPQDNQLCVRWIESGGPSVVAPRHSGFGRLLLERALASDLRGEVDLDFAEGGLRCIIAFPGRENIAQAAC